MDILKQHTVHYIDAEKLIAKINNKLMSVNLEKLGNFGSHRVWAYNDVKNIIYSLQQEQPKSKLVKVRCVFPFDETWEKNKIYTCEVWHHGDLNRNFWDVYYDYGKDPKYVQFPTIELLNKEFAIIQEVSQVSREQPNNMIQWTGNNLKEVIDFTGKSPRFGEWFKSWGEYENYVHTHNDILKLFCEDGGHYEVPIGAWIVKTPDGHNVPSIAKYVQQEQPEGGCSEKPNDLLSEQEPTLPSNLDEAAKDSWAVYEYRESPKGLYSTCYVDGFKAGAKLMAGQGVTKEAVIGMATEEIFINVSQQTLNKLNLFPGDKVIVQIRKKK